MKRPLIGLVLAAALVTPGALMNTAQAKTHGPCRGFYVTPRDDYGTIQRNVKGLIRCAFRWAGIPEQIPTALYVADRESSYYPWAWNRSSDCRGIFQHMGRYWAARAQTYLRPRWFTHWPVSALNARANVLVAAFMVRGGGWGPWSTAP